MEVVDRIEFRVEADSEVFDSEELEECCGKSINGKYYWADASIAKYKNDVKNMLNPDETCIEKQSIKFVIDYPLHNPVTFTIHADDDKIGLTRREIFEKICRRYHIVYDIEHSEKYNGGDSETVPGIFGIYGHDIGDLTIHGIYRSNDDESWGISISS